MTKTPNHGYNIPTKGTTDWHNPLNKNFEGLEVDIPIRDTEINKENYEPKEGAKYEATDSGAVYYSDGENWILADRKVESLSAESIMSVRRIPAGADVATIQKLINEVTFETPSHGYGLVVGRGDDTIEVDTTIVQPSNTILSNIRLRQKNNANLDAIIKSENYDLLTGTGENSTTNGVPSHFGLWNVSIDGNKSNNTSGTGVKHYGKSLISDRVQVWHCPDEGFICESGAGGGDGSVSESINSTTMGSFFIKRCGGDGWVFRGPHDAYVGKVVSAMNGGSGVIITSEGNYAAGGSYFGELHPWGNSDDFVIDAPVMVDFAYADGDPLSIQGELRVGNIYAIHDATVSVEASSVQIDSVTCIGDKDTQADGLRLNGSRISIGSVDVTDMDGDGVVVNGNQNTINHLKSTGNTGCGLNFGSSGNPSTCDISFVNLNKNSGGGLVYQSNGHNRIHGSSRIDSSYVGLDLANSVRPAETDNFNIDFYGSGSNLGVSKQRLSAVVSGDDDTTGFTVPHNMLWTPEYLSVTPISNAAIDAAPVYPDVSNTDTSHIGFEFSTSPVFGTDNVEIQVEMFMGGR